MLNNCFSSLHLNSEKGKIKVEEEGYRLLFPYLWEPGGSTVRVFSHASQSFCYTCRFDVFTLVC